MSVLQHQHNLQILILFAQALKTESRKANGNIHNIHSVGRWSPPWLSWIWPSFNAGPILVNWMRCSSWSISSNWEASLSFKGRRKSQTPLLLGYFTTSFSGHSEFATPVHFWQMTWKRAFLCGLFPNILWVSKQLGLLDCCQNSQKSSLYSICWQHNLSCVEIFDQGWIIKQVRKKRR